MMSTEAVHIMFPCGTLANNDDFSVSGVHTCRQTANGLARMHPVSLLVAQGTYY